MTYFILFLCLLGLCTLLYLLLIAFKFIIRNLKWLA